MNIFDYFDQIYIIHLDDLLDRKELIISQIEKYNMKKVTIIDAVNKNKINLEKLKEKDLIAYKGHKYCKEKININGYKCWCNGNGHEDVLRYTGRVACALSHNLVYENMLKNNYEKCLIFEDDFMINDSIKKISNELCEDIPKDWELMYFCNSYTARFVGAKYNRSYYYMTQPVFDAGAYSIKKEIAEIFVKNMFPIRAAADGYIEKMMITYEKQNIYASIHNISLNGSLMKKMDSSNDNYKVLEKANEKKEELNKKLKKIVNEYNKTNIELIYSNKINMENEKIKVLSFCLYGDKAMYITGMKENILLAKKHFEGWKVYIYYNSTVPEKYINEYKELGANCILCENIGMNKLNWEGMFWRWLPLDDERVEMWLSRDADSRLSIREANLVKEWIESGKTLHSIRDHRCHMHCIMGGMFGINNKLFHEKYKFKKVKEIIKDLHSYYKERPYNVDQIFLNDNLWELLKSDQFAHISNGGRRVYPTDKEIPSVGDFIGKQYRLDDFYENKLKYMDSSKGCYWKKTTSPDVYWSNSSVNVRKDVKFNSEGEYYTHRAKNGFPQNWDRIQIMDGVVIPEEEPKPDKPDKGIYWKLRNTADIYWSNSSRNVKSDIKFKSAQEYFTHRQKNGYPPNWNYIKELDNGAITKNENDKPKLPEPPKMPEPPKVPDPKIEEDKGMYWKNNKSASIFWSNSSINVKANIKFENPDEYFAHRKKNGYPHNWNGIQTMKTKISEEVVNDDPLVSIAISTYEANGKGEGFMRHSFEKIMKQTYKNIEVVVSDHSSDDKIKKVCEEYDKKKYPVKYVHNAKDKGNSSQNTNNAIENCSGMYIKVLFMDDYINNEEAISMIVKEFDKNPEKKWLVHSYKHTKNYKEFYNLHHPKIVSDMIFCNRIGCPSCLTIHNSVKERFDEKLKWFMDSELYSRILKNFGQPIILHTKEETEPLMINLHHDDQVTNTKIDSNLVNKEKEYIKQKK